MPFYRPGAREAPECREMSRFALPLHLWIRQTPARHFRRPPERAHHAFQGVILHVCDHVGKYRRDCRNEGLAGMRRHEKNRKNRPEDAKPASSRPVVRALLSCAAEKRHEPIQSPTQPRPK